LHLDLARHVVSLLLSGLLTFFFVVELIVVLVDVFLARLAFVVIIVEIFVLVDSFKDAVDLLLKQGLEFVDHEVVNRASLDEISNE
jgi:hypothetical protein